MTNLIPSVLTMSSREIAKLCNKRHRNIKRDIVSLCSDLEIDVLKFERIYQDTQNRQQTEYYLDKELVLTLVTGYNAKIRHNVILRWQELEQHNGEDNTAGLTILRAENRRLHWLVDELQDEYCKTHGDALKLLRYRHLGLSGRECAQLLGCSARSISRRLARLKQLGFGEQQALPLAAPQGSSLRFADGEV